ncbi:MAG: pseudouridine synthase [Anaerolineales bacterium]
MPERLQKILAGAGYGSRRECEQFIEDGRVTVDGEVAELGQKADPAADIRLDGRPIGEQEPLAYYLLHKPVGVLSSLQSQGGQPTVEALVQAQERVYPVGRLDLDSEGLILLTNDGELTHRLTHPRFEHEKEYLVWLNRKPSDQQLESWRHGLDLPGLGRSSPARVIREEGSDRQIRVVMQEGMNRQIRVTAEVLGLRVTRLKRIRLGSLSLGDLKPGEWRALNEQEIIELYREVDLPLVQEEG